jgi:hypothetical protein
MDNPGIKSLASEAITVARTAAPLTVIDDLDGMTAITLEAAFSYGAGGTSCSVVVQTTFDDTAWRDIARFDFTTASATKHCNLEGLLSKAVTAYAALGSEGVYDGVLGASLRAVITSVGTYSNTVLSVKASVR